MTAPKPEPVSECICEWPASCNGEGFVDCLGCGGDLCVCAACYGQGKMECPGCDDCSDDEAVSRG